MVYKFCLKKIRSIKLTKTFLMKIILYIHNHYHIVSTVSFYSTYQTKYVTYDNLQRKRQIFACYNPEFQNCEIVNVDLHVRFRLLSFDGICQAVIRCCEFASNFTERFSLYITCNEKAAE